MQSIDKLISNRVRGHGAGWCFTPRSFVDLGSRPAVKTALFRLARKGTIRRLCRGLYDLPTKHPGIGLLAPASEAVAKALAARDTTRLQPSGAYAANLLGLTEQVPAKVVFLTDGPTRAVRIGPQEIVLRRTTPRNMATAGRASGTVIQALRHLGCGHVDEHHCTHLAGTLSGRDKELLHRDRAFAPGWMQPIIERIAGQQHA